MQLLEAAKALQRVQVATVNHLAQKLHATYILTLEALIKRYESHLWLTFDEATQKLQMHKNYEGQVVDELSQLGHGYIAIAAALGYERALRDLVTTGFIKWYSTPVKPPFAAFKDCIDFNDQYIKGPFAEAVAQSDPASLHARLALYSHYLWRVADRAYRYCLRQYSAQTRVAPIKEADVDDIDDDDGTDYTVVFAGPDDPDTCSGCDDAVGGNPYTLDDCPNPGEFECMSNCRHFTQMAEDAPVELAPYEWHGVMGFGSIPDGYYEDVTRDQDLLPRWNVDGSKFHQAYAPSTDGIDLPHVGSVLGDIGRSKALGSILPASSDILSDQLAPAVLAAQEGRVDDLAQWLWDTGLEPKVISEWVELKGLEYAHLVSTYHDIKENHATQATVMTWLRRGDVEKLYDASNTPQFAAIMQGIAANGIPSIEATIATILGNVLGVTPTLDTTAGKWVFDITTPMTEAGTAASGDHGHSGRPGERGGSAASEEAKHIGVMTARALSFKEEKAFRAYTGFDYHAINSHLRGLTTEYEATAEIKQEATLIDTVTSSTPLDETTLYRGMSARVLGLGPAYDTEGEPVFRGIDWKKYIGTEWVDHGFVSVSKDKDWAANWNRGVLAEIHVPAGLHGYDIDSANVSLHSGEREVLLDNDTHFKITGVRMEDNPVSSVEMPVFQVEASQ